MKVAVLSPVWFPVPPSGYGGIEWIVSLLADGLADAGHEVTLFASGDSRTRAQLAAVFEEAPSERIGQTFWELQHALNCFARHDEFDVIHDHTGLMGLALGSLLPTPLVHTVHGPVDGHPGRPLRAGRAHGAAGAADLALAQPARAEAEPAVDRERPERARPLLLSLPAGAGRLPALPRPDEPGQGRAPGGDDRARGRAAAEDRGQVRRAGRAGLLRRARAPAPRRRSRVRRRGVARREGGAAPARAGDRLPDLLAGAVRPRDDRVDGVRDAGDRDPLRRRARGDRGRAYRDHHRRLARDGRRARGGRRARPGRAAAVRRGALHARAHGGRLRRRLRSSDRPRR